MDGFDLRFSTPSNMLVVGPTSSGKPTWLKHLVLGRHEYFATPPETMLLFYKEPQKAYEYMEDDMNRGKRSNTRFPSFRKFKSIPNSIEELKDILERYPRKMPKLVVFDVCFNWTMLAKY